MSKMMADGLRKISTNFLKKYDYFNGYKYGLITWTSYWGDKNSISVQTIGLDDDPRLRIFYTSTDNQTGEKRDFDYDIPLTTTPCHFGGKRHWFICPWYRNGVYCGRRVGTLYKGGDYFACRHCYGLTYESQNASGIAKRFGKIISAPEMDERWASITKTHYQGKPTKKYLRYMQAERKFLWTMNALVEGLNTKKR